MALALNLLALLLVLGSCWAAMMWLSGRFHSHGGSAARDLDFDANRQRSPVQDDVPAPAVLTKQQCVQCEGVGAQQTRGRLEPCPQCLGTGIRS